MHHAIKSKKKKIAMRLIGFFLFLSPVNTYAFPFQKTASSFEIWVNNQRWADGNKRVFERLNNCEFYPNRPDIANRSTALYSPGDRVELAHCWYQGYVSIYSPMGKEVCKLTYISYIRNMTRMSPGKVDYVKGRCMYR